MTEKTFSTLLTHSSFVSAFTEEYPNKPPTVRFVSKMFHPNVYADGGNIIIFIVLYKRKSNAINIALHSFNVTKDVVFHNGQ